MPRPEGVCHICGCVGPLTFEHLPPRTAFNNQGVFEADVEAFLNLKFDGTDEPIAGRKAQRGAGKYSLCEKCNNATGSWYGGAYVEWARRGMQLLANSNCELSLAYPYEIYPLRCIKQIATMFLSACGPEFHKAHPDLVRFVLNKELRSIPQGIRIYAYLLDLRQTSVFRQSGITGRATLGSGQVQSFAEIAFPPFGFVLSPRGVVIDACLRDITYFSSYDFRWRQAMYLKLPVLPLNSPLPGDFRTLQEIRETIDQNRKEGEYYLEV